MIQISSIKQTIKKKIKKKKQSYKCLAWLENTKRRFLNSTHFCTHWKAAKYSGNFLSSSVCPNFAILEVMTNMYFNFFWYFTKI